MQIMPRPKKTNKGMTFPPEVLTTNEVWALVKACGRRSWAGARNRALIIVLWRTGLRCAEALALRTVDIDAEACTVHVMRGKGGKSRTVGMDPGSFVVIEQWLQVRQELGVKQSAPLFCTASGGPVSSAYVRATIRRLGIRASIAKRVHAHMLRHTMAFELRQDGEDIGVISKQLGHSSIATTARYLDHVAPAAVIDAMRKRSLPDGMVEAMAQRLPRRTK